jgi:hypothetical protein
VPTSLDWQDLKDLHAGRTGLIIGNGPSLTQIPLDLLEKYPSFGTNRVYLLKDFAPTYYVSVNPLVIEQYGEEALTVLGEGTDVFFLSAGFLPAVPPSVAGRVLDLHSIGGPTVFSRDPREGTHEGCTVTYVCMQLAWWMGFTRILLVGVDHHFVGLPDRDVSPNEEIPGFDGGDPNHFHPDYFSGQDVRWHFADLEHSEEAYGIAKSAYAETGRTIVNLTPGSHLDVFPKELWSAFADATQHED